MSKNEKSDLALDLFRLKIGLYITNLGGGPLRCGCNKTNNANTDLPLYFIDTAPAPAVHSKWIFVCCLFANLNSQFVGP